MLRFNMKSLILKRVRRSPRRKITIPDIVPASGHRADLERIVLRVVRAWWTASRDQIIPAYRADLARTAAEPKGPILDDARQLGSTTDAIAGLIDRLILTITPDLRDWAVRVEAWHRNRWAASLMPHGIDIKTIISPEDVAQTVEARIEANVSLIRSISSEARTRIEGTIFRGFTARTPVQQIAREISEAIGMSRARALRIAADQTVKLSADLDTERMKQAGIEEWTWIHSGKLHFRKFHKERDGRRYRFDNPPSDMPGELPFCGCRKRAELNLDE